MSEKNDNKVPNVPNLRSAEFTKEWEISTIGKTGFFYYGKSAPKWSVDKNANTPCFRYGQLYTLDKAKIDVVETYTNIDSSQLTFSTGTEVLVPRVGEDPMDFYKCTYLAIKNVAIGEMISVYNTNENPHFMSYYFRATMRKKFARLVEGGNVSNLYYEYLKKISIKLPCRDEQKRIVNFFELLDQRIETQSKIIEKLKSQMNCIIDSIVDFSAPQFKFKDLYTTAGEGGTPSTTNNLFYENGNIPFIKIEDLSNKYLKVNKDFITEQGLKSSSAWIVPANSIIYSNGATIGRISINTYPVSTKQGILGIIPSKIVLTEYLYYFMKSEYFRKQVHRITVKGTMDCAYLKDLNFIKCYIPCLDRQEDIIKTLTLLDEKVVIEQIILNKLKEQKKFLLSNMFI